MYSFFLYLRSTLYPKREPLKTPKSATYYITTMDKLIFYQNGLSLGLFIVGSIFLFLRSEKIRERIILASVMLLWAGNYSIRLVYYLLTNTSLYHNVFFTPAILTVKVFLLLSLIPYVIEMVHPGWVNTKRLVYLTLPWIGVSVFYYGMLWLQDQPIDRLHSFAHLMARLRYFNVWFRFILLALFFGYLFLFSCFCIRYRYFYNRWCNDYEAAFDRTDRSWLRYFAGGMLCATLFFCGKLFNHERIWDLAYQVTVNFVFVFVLYKELFRKKINQSPFLYYTADGQVVLPDYDTRFADNLPGFAQTVDNWMNTTHPYLRKDFKLMDVTDILPLNRTYLSRVFNEGIGCSFNQYIRHRRIEKAKDILLNQPSLTMKEVAGACGFTSVSAFNAAFVKETGLPPSLYRRQDPDC